VARVLIVGGGCRGRQLARKLVVDGHAVRITTRSEAGRAAIESAGAECLIATPDRLATMRTALDGVTVACWFLAAARGEDATLEALHSSRLQAFVRQTIDTTVRGFVYERGAPSAESSPALERGEQLARELAELNAIPMAVLAHDVADVDGWVAIARAAIDRLLDG
jgi:uncharacterized protein YbjT (DUF2867 family)